MTVSIVSRGQPIPALQGIATASRVAFVGTFAKILFPAMRLGYMVVPMALRENFSAALSATGQFAPLITQAALADFINEGHLSRHLRRMRRIYAERRRRFIEQFDLHLGKWLALQRVDSGIQLVGVFHAPRDDQKIAARAAKSNVNVSPLSMQYHSRKSPRGLLFGFAAADEKVTGLAMQRLARVLAEHEKA